MDDFSDTLFKVDAEEFGDAYGDTYLTLYQDYVGSADRISERRHTANSFFLSVNTALLGATSYFSIDARTTMWLVALGGIAFSLTWRQLIASYRSLNAAKFRVINALEQRLPFAAYDAEWKALSDGDDRKTHVPFSTVESVVPLIFIALYAVVFVWSAASWL